MIQSKVRKEYLGVSAKSTGGHLSIMDAAIMLYFWLDTLSKFDLMFSKPYLDRKNDFEVDLTPTKKEESIKMLAEHILRETRNNIEFYEKEKNPDYNYVYRQSGYSLFMKFKHGDKLLAKGSVYLGASWFKGFSINNITEENKTYDWYFQLMNFMINLLNATYANIVILRSIDEYYKLKLDYTLTYISYFSNDFEHKIPDDIESVEYVYSDKGKYLITSSEDFLKDKESFLAHKDKIMRIGRELVQRVPGLVRKF
jgi:hypothetical protein